MFKVAVLLGALAIAPAHAPKNVGSSSPLPSVVIRGTVLEIVTGPRGRTFNQVHAGVVVTARKKGTGPGASRATTDRHGRFRVLLQPNAQYVISVIVGPPTVTPARRCASEAIRTRQHSQQITLRCLLR
jgi:hypothetical protein